MDSTRRTSRSTLRRVAMMAALAALLAPATAAEAATKKTVKKPVITSVSPMDAEIGDILTIRGKYFRKGAFKNTVVFKRDGAKAVFVRAQVATKKLLRVKIPATLEPFMANVGTTKVATRFRLRVLSQRFGKSFTSTSKSPRIGPDTPPPPPPPPSAADADGDCDGDGVRNGLETDSDNDGLRDDVELSLKLDPCAVDTDKDGLEDRWEFDCDRNGVLNRDQADDDSDLLDDVTENNLMLDGCSVDTDGDGVEDGYEYASAVDLNQDEYQHPNQSLPYPSERPYPNPLFADAGVDYDQDVLTLQEEFLLWKYTYEVNKTSTRTLFPLSYSDGRQYSLSEKCPSAVNAAACGAGDANSNRFVPNQPYNTYAKWWGTGDSNVCNGSPCNEMGFLKWADSAGYGTVMLSDGIWWDHAGSRFEVDILDVNRDGVVTDEIDFAQHFFSAEDSPFDMDYDGFVSDDERDEDADGLTNYDETHGRMTSEYWAKCYASEPAFVVKYAGTSHVDADSDNDGVRDGADDVDHDDIPNLHELSRINASNLDDTENGIAGWGIDGPAARTCSPDKDLPKPPADHHPEAYGRVNPFNPCQPDVWSRTCTRHPEFGATEGMNWFSLQ